MSGRVQVMRADARRLPLADGSVDLVVTSPPYFALRSYTDSGEHYDGQIGAETTPQAYLEALWESTAEWARVLKPGGSIFVNLGDAYSKGQRLDLEFTVEDAAWLGGVLDSDGSISIHKQGTSYTAWTRVGQMRPEVVQRIHQTTGVGTVCRDARGVWNWQAAAQQAAQVLARVWPWLHIKRRQALAAIELQERKTTVGGKGRWNALTGDELRHRERIRSAVLTWNAGEQDDYEPPLLPLPDLPMRARWVATKSLMLLPERYRVGCVDRLGLIARAVIVWGKPNGLPESVTDRVRRSHEDWVHLTKSPRYYSAVDEVREAYSDDPQHARWRAKDHARPHKHASAENNSVLRQTGGDFVAKAYENPLGKLPGSVWTIPTEPLRLPAELGVDHFAAFPTEWPRRLVLGWSPREVCTACGEGRRPVVEKEFLVRASYSTGKPRCRDAAEPNGNKGGYNGDGLMGASTAIITGYACACPDTSSPAVPGVVLDPFGGTGTAAHVAAALGRVGVSADLSADYCRVAAHRQLQRDRAAKVLRVDKPKTELPGQGGLFDDFGGVA